MLLHVTCAEPTGPPAGKAARGSSAHSRAGPGSSCRVCGNRRLSRRPTAARTNCGPHRHPCGPRVDRRLGLAILASIAPSPRSVHIRVPTVAEPAGRRRRLRVSGRLRPDTIGCSPDAKTLARDSSPVTRREHPRRGICASYHRLRPTVPSPSVCTADQSAACPRSVHLPSPFEGWFQAAAATIRSTSRPCRRSPISG